MYPQLMKLLNSVCYRNTTSSLLLVSTDMTANIDKYNTKKIYTHLLVGVDGGGI